MNTNDLLKKIPSVHELLDSPPIKTLLDKVNRHVVVGEVRNFLETVRNEVRSKAEQWAEVKVPSTGEMAEKIAKWIWREQDEHLRPVINATGILLHTGLGRAPLAEEAVEALVAVSRSYANVEIDLVDGQRTLRTGAVAKWLCQLTGAEAATVVNNNAGATLLTLAALCGGREVIVSRGELVEIGGSYRLPDVMQASGAQLREVGTTNKTRLSDYERAMHDHTAAILRVHPSNYVIQGFTEGVDLRELVQLAHQHERLLIDDVGSGALIDFARYGLRGEPEVRGSIEAGADVVLFSGDKLLGGPQAGIIVGRRELIDRIDQHPLARALRVDKLTLAALGATLRIYTQADEAEAKIPLLAMLATSTENLRHRAEKIVVQLRGLPWIESIETSPQVTYLGGGSIPEQQLATWCVSVVPRGMSVDELAGRLRQATPAVFPRIHQERLLLDLRSVQPAEDRALVDVCKKISLASHQSEDELSGTL